MRKEGWTVGDGDEGGRRDGQWETGMREEGGMDSGRRGDEGGRREWV